MKTKIRKVSFCDFCNKHSLRSLEKHEKHCTANPDRECRLCDNRNIKEIIRKYSKYFTVHPMNHVVKFKKEFTLEDIKNELDYNCPNCIFAIIRCLGLNKYYMGNRFKFDYKKAQDKWWKITNEEAQKELEKEMYE